MGNLEYESALEQVNLILKDLGKEPIDNLLPGIRGSSYCCPIGRTLNCSNVPCSVSNTGIYVDGRTRYYITESTRNFINKFDTGAYSELVDHKLVYRVNLFKEAHVRNKDRYNWLVLQDIIRNLSGTKW